MDTATIFSCCRKLHMCWFRVFCLCAIIIVINNFLIAGTPVNRRNFMTPRLPSNKMTHTASPKKLFHPWLDKFEEELLMGLPSGDGGMDQWNNLVPFEKPQSESTTDNYFTRSPLPEDISPSPSVPFLSEIDTSSDIIENFSDDVISRSSFVFEGPSSMLNTYFFRPSPQYSSVDIAPSPTLESSSIAQSDYYLSASWTDAEQFDSPFLMSSRRALSDSPSEILAIITAISATHIFGENELSFFTNPSIMSSNVALPSILSSSDKLNHLLSTVHLLSSGDFYTVSTSVSYLSSQTHEIFLTTSLSSHVQSSITFDETTLFQTDLSSSFPSDVFQESSGIINNIPPSANKTSIFFKPFTSCEQTNSVYNSSSIENSESYNKTTTSINFIFPTLKSSGFFDIFTPRTYFLSNVETTVTIVDKKSFSHVIPTYTISGSLIRTTHINSIEYFVPVSIITEDFNDASFLILPSRASLNDMQSQTDIGKSEFDNKHVTLGNYMSIDETDSTSRENILSQSQSKTNFNPIASSELSDNFLSSTKRVSLRSSEVSPSEKSQDQFNISFPTADISTIPLYETKTLFRTNSLGFYGNTDTDALIQPSDNFENDLDALFTTTVDDSNTTLPLNESESKQKFPITFDSSLQPHATENNRETGTHHVTVRSLKDSISYEAFEDPYAQFTSSRLDTSSIGSEASFGSSFLELINQSSLDWRVPSAELIYPSSLDWGVSSAELIYPSSLDWGVSSAELIYESSLDWGISSAKLTYPSSSDWGVSSSELIYQSSLDWEISTPVPSEYEITESVNLSSQNYNTGLYELTPSLTYHDNTFNTVYQPFKTSNSSKTYQVFQSVTEQYDSQLETSLIYDFPVTISPSFKDENMHTEKTFPHTLSSGVKSDVSLKQSQKVNSMHEATTDIYFQSGYFSYISSDDYTSTNYIHTKNTETYNDLESVPMVTPTLSMRNHFENSYMTVDNAFDTFNIEDDSSKSFTTASFISMQSEDAKTDHFAHSFPSMVGSDDYIGIFSSRAPLLSYSFSHTYWKEITPKFSYPIEFMTKISDMSLSKYHDSTKIYSEFPKFYSSDGLMSDENRVISVSNGMMSVDYAALDYSKVIPSNSTLHNIVATTTLSDVMMQTQYFSQKPTLYKDSLSESISQTYLNENITREIPVTVLPSEFKWNSFESKTKSEKVTDDSIETFSVTSRLFPELTPSPRNLISHFSSNIFDPSVTIKSVESFVSSTSNKNFEYISSSTLSESIKIQEVSSEIVASSITLEDTKEADSESISPKPYSEFLKSTFFSNETWTSIMPSFNSKNSTSFETDSLNLSTRTIKDSAESLKHHTVSETLPLYSSRVMFEAKLTSITSSNKLTDPFSIESDHPKQVIPSSGIHKPKDPLSIEPDQPKQTIPSSSIHKPKDPLSIESDHPKQIITSSSIHKPKDPLSIEPDQPKQTIPSSSIHKPKDPLSIESDHPKQIIPSSSIHKPKDPLSIESDHPKQIIPSSSIHKPKDPLSIESDHPKQKTTNPIISVTIQIKPTSVIPEPKSIDSDIPKRTPLFNSARLTSSILLPVKPHTNDLSLLSTKPKDPISIESDLPKTKTYRSQTTSFKMHFTDTPKLQIDATSLTFKSTPKVGKELFPTRTIEMVSGHSYESMTSVLATSSVYHQLRNFSVEASANRSLSETVTSSNEWLIPTMDTSLFKDDYYWIQTILEAPEEGQLPVNFSRTMEVRLANAYSEAFRSKRESDEPIIVKILILKTDIFLRQFDIIYVVEKGGSLIPAALAAEYLSFLRFEQLRQFFGYHAILKARPYRAKETETGSPLPILAIVGGTLGTLFLIFCCFCVYCRCCRPKPLPSSPGSSASGSLERSLSKYGQHNRKHLFREMTHQLTAEMAAQMKHGSTAPDTYLAEKTGRSLPTLPRDASIEDNTFEKSLKILKILENKDASTSPIPGKAVKETTESSKAIETITKKKKHPKPKKRRKVKDVLEQSSKGLTNGQTMPQTQSESPPPTPPPKLALSSATIDKEQSIDSRHISSNPSTPSDKGDERESESSNAELLPPLKDIIAQSKSESEAAAAETNQHLSRVRQRISELLEDAFALAGGRKLHGSLRSKKIEPTTNDIFSRSSSFRSQSAEAGPHTRQAGDIASDPRPISEGGERLLGTITDDGQLITQTHPPPKLVWDEQAGAYSSDRPPVEACNKNINFFPFQSQRIGQLPAAAHSSSSPMLETLPEGGLDTTVPLSSTINILQEVISDQYLAHSSGMNPATVGQYDEIDIVSSLRNGEPVESLIQAIKDELQKFNGSQPKSNENESNA